MKARYDRVTERVRRRNAIEELMKELPVVVSQLVEEVIAEEVKVTATKELAIEIGREYIKITVGDSGESTKCDSASKIETLQRELNTYKLTVERLTQQLNDHRPFSEKCFVTDEYTKFHTGFPNFKLLKAIFDHVSKGLPTDGVTKLSRVCVFHVETKNKRTIPNEGLAYQFGVCKATISKIMVKWLKLADIRLSGLIHWPDRNSLQKTMPECFKKSFGAKVKVIKDCFEIFIERLSNLLVRVATWSNYKHHNTTKVLLGITPQGVVCFVSDCWGGQVSDKHLTENCGLLQKLLADRGFDIAESVGTFQARLHIPALTKGKSQLSSLEVEETRNIANVRIYVERVIGCIKQKYPILQSTLPITFYHPERVKTLLS